MVSWFTVTNLVLRLHPWNWLVTEHKFNVVLFMHLQYAPPGHSIYYGMDITVGFSIFICPGGSAQLWDTMMKGLASTNQLVLDHDSGGLPTSQKLCIICIK